MPELTLPDFLIAVLTAITCGALIGAEREWTHHDAGIRTNALVALGAAIFGLLSMYVFPGPDGDSGRIAAQVVTGVGFLGAGVIIQRRARVIGLTTAATLWVAAGTGLAAGGQHYEIAFGGAIAALVVQIALRFLEVRVINVHRPAAERPAEYQLRFELTAGQVRPFEKDLGRLLRDGGVRLLRATVEPAGEDQQALNLHVRTSSLVDLQELLARLVIAGYPTGDVTPPLH